MAWDRVLQLDNLLHGLEQSFVSFPIQWKQFIDHDDSFLLAANQTAASITSATGTLPLPDGWDDKITALQRVLVLLTTCEHKVMPEIFTFISKQLGVQFITHETPELDRALIGSAPLTPIILISPRPSSNTTNTRAAAGSSAGVDVLAHLSKFVMDQGKSDKFVTISLASTTDTAGGSAPRANGEEGEVGSRTEQTPTASALLSQALAQGQWVFIHHIYRNPAWLVRVEDLLENASSANIPVPAAITSGKAPNNTSSNIHNSLHSEFRLWLHCVEGLDTHVPISLLQKGIKLAIEQPSTIRGILTHLYSRMDERLFGSASKKMVPLFRRLVFILCYFHASMLVRNQYDELLGGWGGKYLFSENDLALGIETIRAKIAECEERNEEITFSMLHFMISEIIYGGHVGASWDMDSMRELLREFLSPERVLLSPEEKFTLPSVPQIYASPPDSSALGLEAYLRTLPLYDSSLAVGLSGNVSRAFLKQETQTFLSELAKMSPEDKGHSQLPPQELEIDQIVLDLEKKLPTELLSSTPAASTNDEDLLRMVARQEYNSLAALLAYIRADLRMLSSMGSSGSCSLLQLRNELLQNKVPVAWNRKASDLAIYAPSTTTTTTTTTTSTSTIPTTKSATVAWLHALCARWGFFHNWSTSNKLPTPIYLHYYTSPKSVFASIIHAYSKKKSVPIGNVILEYRIYTANSIEGTTLSPSSTEEGVFIAGLHLVGAYWNESRGLLEEHTSVHTTFQPLTIYCYATENKSAAANNGQDHTFLCPLFRGPTRTQSSFIASIPLPSNSLPPPSLWSKRAISIHTT